MEKYKKVIGPEVNEIVSCGRKWKEIFHALHKVDLRVCYTKQKNNLACPYSSMAHGTRIN